MPDRLVQGGKQVNKSKSESKVEFMGFTMTFVLCLFVLYYFPWEIL